MVSFIRRVLKVILFAGLVLVIPFLDRHFRAETDTYRIFYSYEDSGYVIRVKEGEALNQLRQRTREWWMSREDYSPFDHTNYILVSNVSELNSKLVCLDQEPFEAYAAGFFGGAYFTDGPDQFIAFLPDLMHLYDFDMPEGFSERSIPPDRYKLSFLNQGVASYPVTINSETDEVRIQIRKSTRELFRCETAYDDPIEKLRDYLVGQGYQCIRLRNTISNSLTVRKMLLMTKSTMEKILYLDEGDGNLFCIVIWSKNGALPDYPEEWYLAFRMKKLYL